MFQRAPIFAIRSVELVEFLLFTALEYKRRLDDGATTMECAEDRELFSQYLRSHKALEKYEQHVPGEGTDGHLIFFGRYNMTRALYSE